LRRATDKSKLEYLESKYDEITELQRTGRYDLMYRKAKELDQKENNGIQTTGTEDSQGNMIVDQQQVLKIWEIYVEELYDRANGPENLNVEPEEVDEDHKGPHILRSEVERAIKEPEARKCTDHRTISLIAHAAKVVASVIRRRSEMEIEDILGEDQFGFRIGKGTRDAIGMLKIISE
jgi:hypothetical protein